MIICSIQKEYLNLRNNIKKTSLCIYYYAAFY